jgi:hypothetical protein
VVAKVEWHQGDLFPRIGFIVTNMSARARGVVHFYNGRGTAEQWIKEDVCLCWLIIWATFCDAWFFQEKSSNGHFGACLRNL